MTRIRSLAFCAAMSAGSLVLLAQDAPTPEDVVPSALPATSRGEGETPLPPPAVEAAASAESPAYVEEIRQADAAYVAAFNAKDAKALAAMWSPDAVYVDRASGEEVEGREAIAAQYAALFEESPAVTLAVDAEAIDLLSPGVIVEHGTATFSAPQTETERVDFVAVWVRRDGTWLLDRVSDQAEVEPSPHYRKLRDLEWMIGEWVDQDDEASVETECRWAKNRNFIVRTYAVSVGGEVDLSGMQVIGWNPSFDRLQSWTFDSDGGFAQGDWTKSGNSWYVRSRGYAADGRRVTATTVIRQIDGDSFGWRTAERIVEGELLPNVDETLVVRRP